MATRARVGTSVQREEEPDAKAKARKRRCKPRRPQGSNPIFAASHRFDRTQSARGSPDGRPRNLRRDRGRSPLPRAPPCRPLQAISQPRPPRPRTLCYASVDVQRPARYAERPVQQDVQMTPHQKGQGWVREQPRARLWRAHRRFCAILQPDSRPIHTSERSSRHSPQRSTGSLSLGSYQSLKAPELLKDPLV